MTHSDIKSRSTYPTILAIESSCDETSAAVIQGGKVRSNIISSQLDHAEYGGVIPELASRLHQQQIVRVVEKALSEAEVSKHDLDAVGFTRGPGLLGALLVGTCFAKSFALGLGKPLVDVNHMQAHVLANFLQEQPPEFPFLCLTVSGGHTQLVLVKDYLDMELMGETIDDAAGEAFDKAAKIMGLPYPGGPEIDKLAKQGDPKFLKFPRPDVGPYDFSFSGLKTSLLYKLKDGVKADSHFLDDHMADICASYQGAIVSVLLDKMKKAAQDAGVKHLAIAGGVSANSELRLRFQQMCNEQHWKAHIPDFQYCTDNAAMIAISAHFQFQAGKFADLDVTPFTRGGL
ncbi:tRNA (adenosine(37)-N6)-threonylcarbamoyltransferase complex transferase subunit TsaD [Pontibacter sp. G13]|uniref:tRNA (adenosine(37)-N6)-threonylcarbamoyltransferase complex transferase subunit TsaD n=1 Tax=Pontibacter sp. G13 TaxID=3074898 RepID=UPI00288962A5|nr:tRNA (adenosine(37)-N6)-threonylcarbamoyltransferase complex transferase subunit TsaD [Pontibacter sp. G13]WNJ18550.1 tRNA (adenosine(37)-N6)-threonylcarbamoyltransferase complex transferase subunit TsaD [Pontibacter sp. G13]